MPISILHNPRCSKSRATLRLLREKGLEPEIIDYLKTPPTENDLGGILQKLKMRPKDLIRFKEAAAKALGLSAKDIRPEAEWVQIMVKHPVLIERPIVIQGERAVIGRPPEKVLEILGLSPY